MDRLVQAFRLGLRLDANLGLQPVPASLILLQRQCRLALLGVDAHQRAVSVFTQRIERDQPACHRNRVVVHAIGHMPGEQSGQGLARKIA